MTKLRNRFFYFYNSEHLCSVNIACQIQPKISSGSGEQVDFVIFAISSNGGHLEYSTWPNFIILRTWWQVMLHVKFENCRYNSFIEKDVWIFVFKWWRTMHDARRTTDYNSAKNNQRVISKYYALLHIIILLSAKFQLRWIKTVGGLIRKQTC